MTHDHSRPGFTLIELLIVIAIITILALAAFFAVSRQRTKAEDAAMKSDLDRLKIAFEDYYNDYNCYPPAEWFDGPEDLASDTLAPYLNRMLYNPKTKLPYVLEKDSTGCRWFKIYTTLNNPDDPAAVEQRTSDPNLGSTLGNYGISSANSKVYIYYNPNNPTSGNQYYCQSLGNCSQMSSGQSCTPSYSDPNCGSTNLCANTVSTCN